jgi:hypothetical protein
LGIYSTFRLSSLYGLILGLKSKATHKPPLTDCKTIEKNLKKHEKTFEKRLTIVNGCDIMVSREREKPFPKVKGAKTMKKQIKVYFDGQRESGAFVQGASVTLNEDYTMRQLVNAIKAAGYVSFATETMRRLAKVS